MDIETLPENERIEIRKEMRILWILWVGILGTPMVLVFIREVFGEKIRENMNVGENFPLDVFTVVMLVVSAVLLVGAFFMRGALLTGRFKPMQKHAEKMAVASRRPVYIMKYRILGYLPLVLSSTPSVFAFMLFIFGAEATIFYSLIVLSISGILYHRPKIEELLELREREE